MYVIFDLALYEFFAVFAGYKHLNGGMNWKFSVCRNLLYGFLVIENFVVATVVVAVAVTVASGCDCCLL